MNSRPYNLKSKTLPLSHEQLLIYKWNQIITILQPGTVRRKARFWVRVRTAQGLGLVVEQNGWQINPVKFFEDSKNMG